MNNAISLIPLGPVCEQLPGWLEERIAELLNMQVSTQEMLPLPNSFYNQTRNQYDGDLILSFIRSNIDSGAQYKLALVDEDCYSEGLNFIFGEATLKGHESFVALPRLKESFYGRRENRDLFFQRALKESIHELGHTLGLVHCADPDCAMHFSNSLADTDRKSFSLCNSCQKRLF